MQTWTNVLRWTIGTVLLTGALSMGIIGIAFSAGNYVYDSDEYSDDSNDGTQLALANDRLQPNIAAYQAECSACHIAYPAQLLPARSWSMLLSQLNDHFGENAELMPDDFTAVQSFLQANAADVSNSRLGKKAMRGLKGSVTPLRITDLPFYTRQHHEVPDKYVTDNPDVGSFSQCQACHGDASQRGIFDEDTVKIPGVRRWDD